MIGLNGELRFGDVFKFRFGQFRIFPNDSNELRQSLSFCFNIVRKLGFQFVGNVGKDGHPKMMNVRLTNS